MKPLSALFLIILLASCGNDKPKNDPSTKDSISLTKTNKHRIKPVEPENDPVLLAHLYQFVGSGEKVDTMLGNQNNSVYYCKIGNFLLPAKKNALLIHRGAVELFIYKNDNPIKVDSITVLDIGDEKWEFQVTYADYNFDGQKDIYIQRTISNGWPMSIGCLITINRRTNKLERHDECDDLANMKPDPKRKVVISDSIAQCYSSVTREEKPQLCKLINIWVDNRLKTMPSRCRCK
jgi:hypothetical protein